MRTIAAIILAAGGSIRLGRAKQLLSHEGRTLIRRAVQSAIGAGCAPVIVVLGAELEGLAREIEDLPPAQIAQNPDWERGLGTSIRKGVAELSRLQSAASAVVLMVCDQPFVTSAVIAALITAHAQTAKPIIASAYARTLGVPALFDCSYFPQLAVLPDERGAKQIISSHLGDVARVPFPQGAIDVDTAADYVRLNRHRTL